MDAPPEAPLGVVTAITPDVELVGDLQVGAEGAHGQTLTGTQTFGADVTEASLTVEVTWDYEGDHYDVVDSKSYDVTAPTGCESTDDETPVASASAANDCFGMEVFAANENAEALATFTFEASNDSEIYEYTPEVDEGFSLYFPIYEEDNEELTVTVTADGLEPWVFTWEASEACYVSFEKEETCDGVEFMFSVPADGADTTFTFTPDGSEEPVVVEVAAGGSDSRAFTVEGDSLEILITFESALGYGDYPYVWESPEGCDEAAEPTTPPAAEPQLPTTGSSMTIMISSAAALVAAAAVLFFIARRRKAAANW